MVAVVRVVAENEIDEPIEQPSVAPLRIGVPEEPKPLQDPRVDQLATNIGVALKTVEKTLLEHNARIGAIEAVAPRLVGAAGLLGRALAAKSAAALALVGCLGLAGVAAYIQSWQSIAILGIVIVGVFAPLVWSSHRETK